MVSGKKTLIPLHRIREREFWGYLETVGAIRKGRD